MQQNTKTSLIDGGAKVYWQPGDAINLFYDGVGSKFVSQNEVSAEVATFKGYLNVMIGFSEASFLGFSRC